MVSTAGLLVLISPSTTPSSRTKRSGLKSPARCRVVFEQKVIGIAFRAKNCSATRFVSAGREVMALEVAAAHVHADTTLEARRHDRIVERVDIKLDQSVGILAYAFHHLADCRVAQLGDRDLVELDIPASRVRRGPTISARYTAARSAKNASIDRNRRPDRRSRCTGRSAWSTATGIVIFASRARDCVQERNSSSASGCVRLSLSMRVGRGELDLVPLVVPKLEIRCLDREPLHPFDETAPVGAATELAVGHDLQTELFLPADTSRMHSSCAVANSASPIFARPVSPERLPQRRGRSRLPT